MLKQRPLAGTSEAPRGSETQLNVQACRLHVQTKLVQKYFERTEVRLRANENSGDNMQRS
jgi:hypothetical protein